MKRSFKKLGISLAAASLLGTTIAATATNTFAAVEQNPATTENSTMNQTNKVLDDATAQKIAEDIKASGVFTTDGEDTTFTISDNAVESILAKYHVIKAPDYDFTRKVGITTIKWHGNAVNGNFDIYISSKMLNKIREGGYSSGFKIALTIIGAVAGVPGIGVATWIIKEIAGKIVGAALGQVGAFKAGRIFKVRSWQYKGWSYQ